MSSSSLWRHSDWGVDDIDPLTGEKRRFGKWRAQLNRPLTSQEKEAIGRRFNLLLGTMTLQQFQDSLPEGVGIVRSRGQLSPGEMSEG